MIVGKISTFQPNLFFKDKKNSANFSFVNLNSNTSDSFIKSQTVTNNNVTFEGIDFDKVKDFTDVISKSPYSKKQLVYLYKQYPEAGGITMGDNLPASWLDRIPADKDFNKSDFCERLGDIFTIDRHYSDIDVLKENLENLFKEHNIITDDDKFDVDYIGKGFFGRAYKVSINDEDHKVIKEFKRTYRYHNNHGNLSEQNVAEYIKQYAGDDTNMVKYYYGDGRSGIMILDYISEDTPKPVNKINLNELGIAYNDDKPRNYVNGYIIDYGGIISVNNLAGNKTAQDVHKMFKNLQDDRAKHFMFDRIIADSDNKEYIDKLIGLTHSISYFPKEDRDALYQKIFDIGHVDLKVALVENLDDFVRTLPEVVESLASSPEKKVKVAIAKRIKNFPEKLKHELFENLSLDPSNNVRKYLARNLNFYYLRLSNRSNIYENMIPGTDCYKDIALINSINNISEKHYDDLFTRFYEKNNVIIDCALARNIEVFGENNLKLSEKWVNKLLEIDDVRVKRALAESITFVPVELQKELFNILLDVDDMNTKEFLAEGLVKVPNINIKWIPRLVENADNSVFRALALNLKNISSPIIKEEIIKAIYEKSDSSVKSIIEKNR